MDNKTIGMILKKAREGKDISLAEASKQTRIRDHFIAAIEEGKFDQLPSPAQVQGFLRNYANFLGIDSSQFREDEILPAEKISEEVFQANLENVDIREARYTEIGNQLKARRDLLGLTLEEVVSQTRIAERYLTWLEKGEFDQFPSPTQARGMLTNYAGFLGLEKELVPLFGEVVQDDFEKRSLSEDASPKEDITDERRRFRMPRWIRRYLSFDILAGVALSAVLAGVFFWGIGQVASLRSAEEIDPTAPPLAEILIPNASPTIEASPSPESGQDAADFSEEVGEGVEEVPQITIQVANPSGVEVVLFPSQREWVRVTVDGQVQFEGRVVPGESYGFSGSDQVVVFTGNAAAFRVFLNNQDLGLMGIEGEVIELLFSREGAATPSPSAIPTDIPVTPSATPEGAVDDANNDQ